MKILAFDQATTKTGYACMEAGVVDYGLINLSGKAFKGMDADKKGRLTVKAVGELIEAYQPNLVVIEDVALQRNAKVLIELSRIQGGIISLCDKLDVAVTVMKPSQWRKLCRLTQGAGVRRPQLKLEAKQFVEETFGIKATSDEADAICIAWAAYLLAQKEVEGGNADGKDAGKEQ